MNDSGTMPLKRSGSPKTRAAARPAYAVSTLRFVQLRAMEDEYGGGITLIVFTVEVPQTSTGHGDLRQALPSTLSVPDHWIAFQI
jgi:hypothetical protein